MKKMTALALVACLCLCPRLSRAADFKFIKKDATTSLYERWVKNTSGNQVRELQAVFFCKGSISEVVATLQNASLGKKWNTKASIYKIVATGNTNQWVNYVKYDMPAMMDDQDCCLLYSLPANYHAAMTRCEIRFVSAKSEAFPTASGVSRISGVKGSWLLEKVDDSRIKITYTISSNRNPNIPRMVSDPIIRDNLLTSMNQFKKLIES